MLVIGINQYQLDSVATHFEKRLNRTAELTLASATANQLTRDQLDDAFRARDRVLKKVQEDIAKLREGRAQIGENLGNVNRQLGRIVDVSIETTNRASATEGQLNQLLNQMQANAALVTQMVDRYQQNSQIMAERLTRLESQVRPTTPVGTP